MTVTGHSSPRPPSRLSTIQRGLSRWYGGSIRDLLLGCSGPSRLNLSRGCGRLSRGCGFPFRPQLSRGCGGLYRACLGFPPGLICPGAAEVCPGSAWVPSRPYLCRGCGESSRPQLSVRGCGGPSRAYDDPRRPLQSGIRFKAAEVPLGHPVGRWRRKLNPRTQVSELQ